MELPPPISGDELERRLKEKIVHNPIIEGLLYEGASLMISSQPSVGKSVLALQAAYELSLGMPVFGTLYVPKPVKVWYIQMERSEIESLERLQLMRGNSTAPLTNLYIDTELQALNFLNPAHFDYILKRGKTINPGLVMTDPLYGIASGLSKDEVASNVAKMFTIFKKELNCALWLNHHTTKNIYEIIEGKKYDKEDPFYGAQWLKAHVTGSYFVKELAEKNGVVFTNKKDSHGCLLKEITTSFDHDTYLSTIIQEDLEVIERYKLFINSRFKGGKKTFYFDDAKSHLGCAVSTLRAFHRTPLFQGSVRAVKSNGHRTLYEVYKEI